MITSKLIFGRDDEHRDEAHGTADEWEFDATNALSEARLKLEVCRRFDHFLFLETDRIVIENRELGCYLALTGNQAEIAELSAGLSSRMPPENTTSYWLDHLRH